jgi:nucleotide-binding universal stress UspA family protein
VGRLHRVLAAVDFSEAARAAFDRALALSRRHDAELTVVHAIPTNTPVSWDGRERTALISALRHAASAAGVRFEISVQSGDPAGVIVLHAMARRPDLIVLGTGARSGFDRFRLGSVAETVARQATQPVLVVPATAGRSAQPTSSFKSIVVAVDFSETSKAAVEKALSIAGEDTRVTLVHVIPGMPRAGASRYRYHLMEPEYQRQVARDAWRRISQVIPAHATGGSKVHARVVTGDPSAEIARVATEAEADLILVGMTPRGAVSRLLFGSTTARVIRAARVPVLTMPPLVAQTTAPLSEDDRFTAAA